MCLRQRKKQERPSHFLKSWTEKSGQFFEQIRSRKRPFFWEGRRGQMYTQAFEEILSIVFTCRWCLGVVKSLCTSSALLFWEGCSYPTLWCRYVDVFVDARTLRPSVSALDEYHIPRVLSLVTSENLFQFNLMQLYFMQKCVERKEGAIFFLAVLVNHHKIFLFP